MQCIDARKPEVGEVGWSQAEQLQKEHYDQINMRRFKESCHTIVAGRFAESMIRLPWLRFRFENQNKKNRYDTP